MTAIVEARQPVKVDPSTFNKALAALEESARIFNLPSVREAFNELQAVITVADDCIDGDGSGLCETHNYLPMAYYLDVQGNLLKRGSFDPEDTGFPVCPDSQKYDERLERRYNR